MDRRSPGPSPAEFHSPLFSPAVPKPILAASVFDEDPAHGLGRGGKEVTAMFPLRGRGSVPDEPQIGFVDQRGRLQRLSRPLVGDSRRRPAAAARRRPAATDRPLPAPDPDQSHSGSLSPPSWPNTFRLLRILQPVPGGISGRFLAGRSAGKVCLFRPLVHFTFAGTGGLLGVPPSGGSRSEQGQPPAPGSVWASNRASG